MLYELHATPWRVLRRLHLAGGAALWKDVRPAGRKHLRERHQSTLSILQLISVEDESVRLTDRGVKAQALGEVDVTIEELRALTQRRT